ncbi:MAG: hypothetical protein V3S02_04155 [Dehalococcoidales bacterium]
MPDGNLIVLMGIGGFFIVLGLAAIIWDRNEEKGYYDSISSRPDTREFLDKWPPRAQFGALKIGGRISLAIGVLMLIIGGVFWLLG